LAVVVCMGHRLALRTKLGSVEGNGAEFNA
jgi:hypothetical protein